MVFTFDGVDWIHWRSSLPCVCRCDTPRRLLKPRHVASDQHSTYCHFSDHCVFYSNFLSICSDYYKVHGWLFLRLLVHSFVKTITQLVEYLVQLYVLFLWAWVLEPHCEVYAIKFETRVQRRKLHTEWAPKIPNPVYKLKPIIPIRFLR